MGLDSFWGRPDEKKGFKPADDVTMPRDLNLCGGMFSGHGSGSFRGKVYSDLIAAATGHSLYQEEIGNNAVTDIAGALEAYTGDPLQHGITAEELADLRTMFRTYADAGCHLYGWW